MLLALSLGRYDARQRKASDGLVVLLGAAVRVPGVVLTGAWLVSG